MVKQILFALASIIVAMVLQIMPLPTWAVWWRPEWVLLVMIYWLLMTPTGIGLGMVCLAGLYMDGLQGTLMGEHVFVFTAVAYFVIRLKQYILLASMRGQMLIVGGLVLFSQLLLLWIQGLIGQLPNLYWYWLATVTSVLFWPWIYWLLSDCQEKMLLQEKLKIG